MRFVLARYGLALLIPVTIFAAPPPSVIWSRYGLHNPDFISASAMVAADGSTSAIAPEDWRPGRPLARFLSAPTQVSPFSLPSAAPCSGGIVEESPELWVDTSTPHAAIVKAHAIVAGTIRSVTPGFFPRQPGSLIELGNLDKIKADTFYDGLRESLFLRLPYAQFVIGGVGYCRESGPGAYIPRVGDRLLVFAYRVPTDTGGTFLYTSSSEVIAQPDGGVIRIPRFLSVFGDQAATIETIVNGVRSELSRRD